MFSDYGSRGRTVNIGNNQVPNPRKSSLKSAVDHVFPDEAIPYYTDAFQVILNIFISFSFIES